MTMPDRQVHRGIAILAGAIRLGAGPHQSMYSVAEPMPCGNVDMAPSDLDYDVFFGVVLQQNLYDVKATAVACLTLQARDITIADR